jgi:hypothetical protein
MVRQVDGRRARRPGLSRGLTAVGAVLGAGLLAAACSSGSTGTATTVTTAASGASATTATSGSPATTAGGSSTAGIDSLVNSVSKSSSATFSATYLTVQASTGKSQSVTFAQSPPKSAIVTPSGSFFVDGSAITACQGSGSTATCTALPSDLTSEVNSLTDLFSPSIIVTALKGMRLQAAAHAAGYSVTTSSATYGGLASTCVTAKSPAQPQVTYCGSDTNGVLTYVDAGGTTVTLQSFTADPPASTLSPPSGATVQTLPSSS